MKTPRLKPKKGWAVEIISANGVKLKKPLLYRHYGTGAVFASKSWAQLRARLAGTHCRVVRVLYAEPIRI